MAGRESAERREREERGTGVPGRIDTGQRADKHERQPQRDAERQIGECDGREGQRADERDRERGLARHDGTGRRSRQHRERGGAKRLYGVSSGRARSRRSRLSGAWPFGQACDTS